MLLTEKVREILINLGEYDRAKSNYYVQILSDRFYNHFQDDIINHTPIKQFIIQEIKNSELQI